MTRLDPSSSCRPDRLGAVWPERRCFRRPPNHVRREPECRLRIRTFSGGLRAALWYPTLSAEAGFQYSRKLSSTMALDAPVAGCGAYPLVVFLHGFGSTLEKKLPGVADPRYEGR